ncbi:MAG: Gamma-glutamyltransferase [Dehalococcoidia bacterium]|nr:Gamma-glutamyltransferase [Dehalococcoidia bacterium]
MLNVALDLTRNPYDPGHHPLVTTGGVVAASQPDAVEAGLTMLRRGGNAVDAALATAIALTVVEPVSNGIGSDAFALIWDGRELHGLNGSGRAPGALSIEAVHAAGHHSIPSLGWLPVTVPGAPAAWRDLHARFGKVPFADLFGPAIELAEKGFHVTPIIAGEWAYGTQMHSQMRPPEFSGWMPTFAPGNTMVHSGALWASPDHAATLRRMAQAGVDDFYTGRIAEGIAAFSKRTGGFITTQDLAAHTSTWVKPISVHYRGYDVWEIPPNGQGIAALISLNILEGLDVAQQPRDTTKSFHMQIEAMKLGFADALNYVADPEFVDVPVEKLLDKRYAARRRSLIGEHAITPRSGDPYSGGTVYLCTADRDGMMVSYIQSNYVGFGSGIVVPGTGISLQNRGSCFTLDPEHPNRLQPGKRPYHTIIPAFMTRDGQAVGPFGVMGAFMQPQGHLQMVSNTIDYAMNPQASLDAPRWQWTGGRQVMIEADIDRDIAYGLLRLGHEVSLAEPGGAFGRGQIIWRLPSGDYVAGSDKRGDGHAGAVS